jgi:phosphoribosylformimino-5-aminoimidazole carboxamide ribotide isomerase
MQIYPAIDIKGGRAVRLMQGRAADATDYGDPVAAALNWKRQGATYLHVVDLDGAFEGKSENLQAVEEIVRAVGLPVQLGGGIRTMADVEQRLKLGVQRVILGTAALENPELVQTACALFPGRIACGIDARDGRVAVRGWVEEASVSPRELALRMKDFGVMDVIYTDISRDGMQTGPNVEATRALVQDTGMNVIGSGGVGALQDLYDLQGAGCAGAIVGKALYNGNFTLAEALKLEA